MRTCDYTLILTSYYLKNTTRTREFCERFKNCTKIVVCNSAEVKPSDFGDSWIVLKGSNDAGEFSAWQEGLNWSLRNIEEPRHGYIFVNDTVNSHRQFSFVRLHYFKKFMLKYRNHAVGFTDTLNRGEQFSIHGLSGRKWLSTYCFYLSYDSLKKIDFTVNSELLHRESPDTDNGSLFPASMSENLRTWLEHWLFGGGWYKSKSLTKTPNGIAEFKARAIVNEKMLSLRLTDKNVEIVSVMAQAPRIAQRLDNLMEKLHSK